MKFIGVEEAFQGLQIREDSIRDAASVFDQAITKMREATVLPADINEWPAAFASRVVVQNKEYRLRVKQELYTVSHSLKHLYADGGEDNDRKTSLAMKMLISVLIDALKNNRSMKKLLDEFTTLHRRLSEAGPLSLADRVFIRKSLPDLQLSFKKLSSDAEAVKRDFDTFKPSFYVIAYEREVKLCQKTLGNRKTTKEKAQKEVQPLFNVLRALAEERTSVIKQCADLSTQHGLTWFELPSERIPLSEYRQALQEYDLLHDCILGQKGSHDATIELLKVLENSMVTSPRTLPGPYKKEIDVSTLGDAYAAYERICSKSRDMLQLSKPIVETLEKYVALLRKGDILLKAFSD